MKTWALLYALIWIAFLEFLLVMTPAADRGPFVLLHIAVGVIIVALSFVNFQRLRATQVPGRVKRIARSTVQLSVAAGVLGVLLAFKVGSTWVLPIVGITVYGLLDFLHVVNAFAIITQAAAVAIAHDMWEDREFEKETEPGFIPELPKPQPKIVIQNQ
ncbi:MAG: hypothetical protein AABY30_02735 [Candidatus Thermoplasmatota archaeon]